MIKQVSFHFICKNCQRPFQGTRKDRPNRVFCSPRCHHTFYHGSQHPHWKGGRARTVSGYIWVYAPDHQMANHNYVYEHRLVMEQKLGRYLSSDENVHHINGKKDDNRIENLVVISSSDHLAYHRPARKLLDESKVIRIRRLAQQGMPRKTLAQKFHVKPCTIADVLARRSWRHVS